MIEMNSESIRITVRREPVPTLMDFSEVMAIILAHRADDSGRQPVFTRMDWPSDRVISHEPEARLIAEYKIGGDESAETLRGYTPTYDDMMAGDWMEV